MRETNGMEPILWFKTQPKDKEPSIFETYCYDRLDNLTDKTSEEVVRIYALKSTSDSFKDVDCIELDEIAMVDEKDGNCVFSGNVISGCDIKMSNDDEANPIYCYQPRYKGQDIGTHDMRTNNEVAVSSPIIGVEINNREKVEEMINEKILTFPDSKCIEFGIEPFTSEKRLAA